MTKENILNKERIFIAGHNGMVGSAVCRQLNHLNLITANRSELDLINQENVRSFFEKHQPTMVVMCAAKVGGILANNSYRAEFIYNNLQIASNLIHHSKEFGVKKLINLGSSCIYPKEAKIPIKEESLLSGKLEPTNEPYAVAKIAALKMCQSYFDQYQSNFYSLMPCNLYGIGDNFDLKTSHVLPALIRKIHNAKLNNLKSVEIWGSGKPLREFLFVDDLAKAIEFCLINIQANDVYSKGISHLNCGSDEELSIMDLVYLISKVIDYQGDFHFDSSKPDGTFRKKMDNSIISSLGFKSETSLEQGLFKTYEWFKTLNLS